MLLLSLSDLYIEDFMSNDPHLIKCKKYNLQSELKVYLAKEGAVGLDPGVAPRDHPEVDGGD
uniref:Uncharacterized protein n=1 Tax=Cucumis melo TaxID=3656 RepID=A0A9I9EGF2_CUCME